MMRLGLTGCSGVKKGKNGGVFVTELDSCLLVSQIHFGKGNGYVDRVRAE